MRHVFIVLYLPVTEWDTYQEQGAIMLPLSITWESRPWTFHTHMTGYDKYPDELSA